MENNKLHIISTGKQKPELLADIVGRIHPYIDCIHLREKTKTAKEIYKMVELLIDQQVPLSKIVINDRADVAYVSNAKGVQLAYHSLPVEIVKRKFSNLTVGCSVHSIEEAQMAEQQGADYLIFGHVYSTQSKPGLRPKGIDQLRSVSESVSIPVIAIGGIMPANIKDVIKAGTQGVAIMSGILEAKDPFETVQQYRSYLSS
ncbi:thiamine phosphate synthase [Planococcus antarcticus DSM 14505]|uniref:Thiamine phosphate synthase n=2 Tax=Planococcus antarcticus DSM 14505 TaxID=1185653 RepID=A0ABM6D384_9BACL|nr:thiazole tautomerase TenI [Planococcus antarcticus]ANU09647.1 thiamine phosphate synthase [Planococcus antarcticus DSM 14505]